MDEIKATDRRDHRFLRYYAKSLLQLGPAGQDWPGFRYTPDEWQRLELYGATVKGAASGVAIVSGAIIFIVIAALVIGLLFVPAMTLLYPDPAKTSALVFVSCLFATAFLILGIGYPIALNAGGLIADRWAGDTPIVTTDADRLLAAKVRHQIWRMMGILCGIGIPGSMILVIYDIDLGPLVRTLKPLAYGGLAAVMAFTAWSNSRRKA
ncbi:MAG: hypothetical protein ACHQAQ_12445 [Hyphomicrobiales bacterium]